MSNLQATLTKTKSVHPNASTKSTKKYTDADLAAMGNAARGKIPTSQLTPLYKQKRARVQELRKPFLPGFTYSGSPTNRDIVKEQRAAVQTTYGPQEDAIKQQQTNIPAYYQDYLNTIASLQARVNSEYTGLQGTSGSAEAAQGNTGGLQGADATAAAASRQRVSQAVSGALSASQGQQVGALGQMGAQGAAAKLQKLQNLSDQLKQLKTQEGSFAQDFLDKRKQTELQNALTIGQLGNAQQKESDTVKTANAKIKSSEKQTAARDATSTANTNSRLTSSEQQTEARLTAAAKQGALNRADKDKLAKLKTKAAGKTKTALTPAQQVKAYSRIQTLASRITDGGTVPVVDKTGKQTGTRKATQQELYSTLRAQGYQDWEIHAAQDLRLKGGKLSPANVHILHLNGIHKIPTEALGGVPGQILTKTQQKNIIPGL